MSATLKTLKATVQADGTVRLDEPVRLNEAVQAVVTLLVEDGSEASATDEVVAGAAAKVFGKHDELFRKLAQ